MSGFLLFCTIYAVASLYALFMVVASYKYGIIGVSLVLLGVSVCSLVGVSFVPKYVEFLLRLY